MDVKKLVALCAVSIFLSACGGSNCDTVPPPVDNDKVKPDGDKKPDDNKKPGDDQGGDKKPADDQNTGKNGYMKPDPALVRAANAIVNVTGDKMRIYHRDLSKSERLEVGGFSKKTYDTVAVGQLPAYTGVLIHNPQSSDHKRRITFMTTGMYSGAYAYSAEPERFFDKGALYLEVDKITGLWTEPNSQVQNFARVMRYKGKNSAMSVVPSMDKDGKISAMGVQTLYGDVEAKITIDGTYKFEGKITGLKHIGSTIMDVHPGSKQREGISEEKNMQGQPISVENIEVIELTETAMVPQRDTVFKPNKKFNPKTDGYRGVGVTKAPAIARNASGEVINKDLRYSVTMAGDAAQDIVGYVGAPIYKKGGIKPVVPFSAGRYQ